MKIQQEHVEFIDNAIRDFNTVEAKQHYVSQGLSAKRYRWDLLYKAGLSKWLCDNIYPYANDDHIDTVLRSLT